MEGFEATRQFRGNTYHITVKNPSHSQKGVSMMIVNGSEVKGNMIPATTETGKDITVEVIM